MVSFSIHSLIVVADYTISSNKKILRFYLQGDDQKRVLISRDLFIFLFNKYFDKNSKLSVSWSNKPYTKSTQFYL